MVRKTNTKSNTGRAARNGAPLTVAALAAAKRLPGEFLIDEVGLRHLPGGVGIPYFGLEGEEIAVKHRTGLRAKEGSFWPRGKPLAAYGSWRLDRANRAGFLILVEGESDCWVLWHHGLPALGLPGSGTAGTLLREHVEGVSKVYVVREPDKGGGTFVGGVAARLKVIGYRGDAVEMRMPEGAKDPADLHVKDPEKFLDTIKGCLLASQPLRATADCGDGGGNEKWEPPREGQAAPVTRERPGASPADERPHLTDRGNAMRVVRESGRDLRHCFIWRRWQAWDGRRWRTDDTAEATRRAKWMIVGLFGWAIARLTEIKKLLESDADDQEA
jgi:putative DNA primase/helicase